MIGKLKNKKKNKLRRLHILIVLILISIAFLLVGSFYDREIMKFSLIGIILFTMTAFFLTWGVKGVPTEGVALSFITGLIYAFISGFILFTLMVAIDAFLVNVENPVFALFSCAFIGMQIGRLTIARYIP